MGIEGVILAAGLSSRAKTFKMTLEFMGKTIIENTIDTMADFCDRIIVVGGYGIEKLQHLLAKNPKVVLVFNEGYEYGMFSSVKKGVSQVISERFFFTPGDCPLISPEVYRELLKYDGDIIIPTFDGRRGHPVLFKREAIEEILSQDKYESLREFIGSKEPVLVPVFCRGILRDVDTMADYEEILKDSVTRG